MSKAVEMKLVRNEEVKELGGSRKMKIILDASRMWDGKQDCDPGAKVLNEGRKGSH